MTHQAGSGTNEPSQDLVLSYREVEIIHNAVTEAGLNRNALLSGLNPQLVATLPEARKPNETLLMDLNALNRRSRYPQLADQLRLWIESAVTLMPNHPTGQEQLRRILLEHWPQGSAPPESTSLPPANGHANRPAAPKSPTVSGQSNPAPSRDDSVIAVQPRELGTEGDSGWLAVVLLRKLTLKPDPEQRQTAPPTSAADRRARFERFHRACSLVSLSYARAQETEPARDEFDVYVYRRSRYVLFFSPRKEPVLTAVGWMSELLKDEVFAGAIAAGTASSWVTPLLRDELESPLLRSLLSEARNTATQTIAISSELLSEQALKEHCEDNQVSAAVFSADADATSRRPPAIAVADPDGDLGTASRSRDLHLVVFKARRPSRKRDIQFLARDHVPALGGICDVAEPWFVQDHFFFEPTEDGFLLACPKALASSAHDLRIPSLCDWALTLFLDPRAKRLDASVFVFPPDTVNVLSPRSFYERASFRAFFGEAVDKAEEERVSDEQERKLVFGNDRTYDDALAKAEHRSLVSSLREPDEPVLASSHVWTRLFGTGKARPIHPALRGGVDNRLHGTLHLLQRRSAWHAVLETLASWCVLVVLAAGRADKTGLWGMSPRMWIGISLLGVLIGAFIFSLLSAHSASKKIHTELIPMLDRHELRIDWRETMERESLWARAARVPGFDAGTEKLPRKKDLFREPRLLRSQWLGALGVSLHGSMAVGIGSLLRLPPTSVVALAAIGSGLGAFWNITAALRRKRASVDLAFPLRDVTGRLEDRAHVVDSFYRSIVLSSVFIYAALLVGGATLLWLRGPLQWRLVAPAALFAGALLTLAIRSLGWLFRRTAAGATLETLLPRSPDGAQSLLATMRQAVLRGAVEAVRSIADGPSGVDGKSRMGTARVLVVDGYGEVLHDTAAASAQRRATHLFKSNSYPLLLNAWAQNTHAASGSEEPQPRRMTGIVPILDRGQRRPYEVQMQSVPVQSSLPGFVGVAWPLARSTCVEREETSGDRLAATPAASPTQKKEAAAADGRDHLGPPAAALTLGIVILVSGAVAWITSVPAETKPDPQCEKESSGEGSSAVRTTTPGAPPPSVSSSTSSAPETGTTHSHTATTTSKIPTGTGKKKAPPGGSGSTHTSATAPGNTAPQPAPKTCPAEYAWVEGSQCVKCVCPPLTVNEPVPKTAAECRVNNKCQLIPEPKQ